MTSPFKNLKLVPLGEFRKPGIRAGLKLPSGEVFLDFDPEMSGQMQNLLCQQLNAEVVNVPGTWIFEPEQA